MAKETMEAIRQAEAAADQTVLEARREAERIVDEAKKDAASRREQAKRDAAAAVAKAAQDAQKLGQQELEQSLREGADDAQALKALASAKKTAAVKLVTELVI